MCQFAIGRRPVRTHPHPGRARRRGRVADRRALRRRGVSGGLLRHACHRSTIGRGVAQGAGAGAAFIGRGGARAGAAEVVGVSQVLEFTITTLTKTPCPPGRTCGRGSIARRRARSPRP